MTHHFDGVAPCYSPTRGGGTRVLPVLSCSLPHEEDSTQAASSPTGLETIRVSQDSLVLNARRHLTSPRIGPSDTSHACSCDDQIHRPPTVNSSSSPTSEMVSVLASSVSHRTKCLSSEGSLAGHLPMPSSVPRNSSNSSFNLSHASFSEHTTAVTGVHLLSVKLELDAVEGAKMFGLSSSSSSSLRQQLSSLYLEIRCGSKCSFRTTRMSTLREDGQSKVQVQWSSCGNGGGNNSPTAHTTTGNGAAWQLPLDSLARNLPCEVVVKARRTLFRDKLLSKTEIPMDEVGQVRRRFTQHRVATPFGAVIASFRKDFVDR